jgi:hypothetical protein
MMSTIPVAARRNGRVEPPLGEVGDGVGAESAERCGHRHQKDEVAGGVADGVPEGAEPFEHGQPGDPEKGGGGEVLPEMAEALRNDGTWRAATRKSAGVRAMRTPRAPMMAVMTVTASDGRDGGRLGHCSFSSSTKRCSRRSARRTYQYPRRTSGG